MNQPNRRTALKSSAALAACSITNSSLTKPSPAETNSPSQSAKRNQLGKRTTDEQPVCLTPAEEFYTVARGNPKPHTLTGQALVDARMTPDRWRLEIVADDQLDPPLVKHKAVLEKPKLIKNNTAINYQQLLEIGKTRSVKLIKAIQCLNIPTPLGQGLWEGVVLRDVLNLCGRINHVRRVYYWGFHNRDPAQKFQSSLSYSQVFETAPGELPVFLAYKLNGQPISPLRGGPVRMIVPWAYGFKSIKWLEKIVFTNDPRANDTYSLQNNDPDSPLKTAAYIDRANPKRFGPDEQIRFRGLVISGLSGLDSVEYLIHPIEEGVPFIRSDSMILDDKWKKAKIEAAPRNFGSILPRGVLAQELMNFDSKTGAPKTWPMRYGMAGWSITHDEKLDAGKYELRVRSIDQNGYVQPEPRPQQKSGRNEIQIFKFSIG